MKNKLLRLRVLGIILIYCMAALMTMADKLEFTNEWDLGLDLDYWGSNGEFLSTLAFWLNIFLYSILPVIIAFFAIKDKVVIYSSFMLPLFWGFFLYRSISAAHSESGILFYDLKYFMSGFLIVATIIIFVKLLLIVRSIRIEETIEDLEKRREELEKFKKKALRKLSQLNPEHNQELLRELLGMQGEALNLLQAAHCYEDDEDKQLELTRIALHYAVMEKTSLETLQKRMARISRIDE